jgi:hypothetical protein
MQYTEKEYRALNRYSNSDLTAFKKALIGDNRPLPKAAFNFGSVVHGILLEPENLTHKQWTSLSDDEQEKASRIYEAVQNYSYTEQLIKIAEREQVHFTEFEGLPCKAKIDLKYDDLIVDIKTTSSQNIAAFCEAIQRFDYHRQAAFYLDATDDGKEFVFIGLQKHAPFEIFHVELTKWHGTGGITQGRTEYRQLLKQIKSTNFVPSSWELARVTN